MYMLFGNEDEYYAEGGMNDFIGYFETEKEAMDHATILLKGSGENSWDWHEWVQLYDMDEKKIVFAVGNPYGSGSNGRNIDRKEFVKGLYNEK